MAVSVFSIVKGSFRQLSSAPVSRRIFVGIRLDPELKEALEEIAGTEERSVSQICELLLRRGIDAYKSEGSKYLRSLGRHRKKESGSE
jgi:hypothetical protein